MPPLGRTHNRYSSSFQSTLSWASIGALIHKLNFFLCPHWPIVVGGPNYQDAERSCSHLGTMVEFAVALGSKLGVINKHSFNNFRLRVGEGPPLLAEYGTSSPLSESFIGYSLAHPWTPLFRLTPWAEA